MKYLSKEWDVRMRRSGLGVGLKPDPRAEMLDEALYAEVHESKRRALVEMIRQVYAVPEEETVRSIIQSKQHAVEIGLITPVEADMDITRAKAWRAQIPPFDEEGIIQNFERTLKEKEAEYQRSLPEEILRRVADLRILALGYAAPDVHRDIVKWCEENRRYVEEVSRASNEQSKAAEAFLPMRTARLLHLHDAQVERVERDGGRLTLHIGGGDNHYSVLAVRLVGCEILKWEDPSGFYWLAHEIERLPDGRYSLGILFDGLKTLGEIELTTRDIEIDSPTTEEDLKAEDEKFRRLLANGILRRVSDLKPRDADDSR